MTQIEQHELRLQNTNKDTPGPTVYFRDLSNLIKDSRHNSNTAGRQDGGPNTGTAEAPITLDSDGVYNQEADAFEEPDAWEREIGLDEVIE
ncbi:hypothetical protein RSAG8_07811, partial [Rhizoctonia solani AG-8 WAC10335]